ncbi:hypothetical protein SAMN05421833_10838 [Microbispora rosea]|uniref:Uncharacterized protein n=1 Tax=Microbispora rosea TaxID=58117 RepID=A0A1N7A5Y5_9ACTN|nr:hypothetical protein SAMN05421833_10838 [Microbispora rosea]
MSERSGRIGKQRIGKQRIGKQRIGKHSALRSCAPEPSGEGAA